MKALGAVTILALAAQLLLASPTLAQTTQPAPVPPIRSTQGQDIPLCAGRDSSASSAQPPDPKQRSVTLRWNASVPASSSPRDAVKGYFVYRRLVEDASSKGADGFSEADRMNSTALQETRCVDWVVESGKTYHYAVTAIAVNGATSGFSVPATATIP